MLRRRTACDAHLGAWRKLEPRSKTVPPDPTLPFEVLRPDLPRGGFRAVLFDFDGTLSLIRRNWQNVMIPMMVDALSATATRETREELFVKVEEFVMRLNGRQTIYQMMQLADEVHARGGSPLDPLDYKRRYHDLLWEQVGKRVADLKQGRAEPDDWTVPGTRALLTALCERGLSLFLASGTDLKYVRDEAQTLRLGHFFGPHIYGALDDYKSFSKALVIRKMIDEMGVRGEELLAFGDGFVEIEEVRRAGGVAVGVASEEERRAGINDWKRRRLIRAGADVIIGDYRRLDDLLELLGLAVNS